MGPPVGALGRAGAPTVRHLESVQRDGPSTAGIVNKASPTRSGPEHAGIVQAYPVNITEFFSGDGKTVHAVEDRRQLQDLLRETFRSSAAISKIEMILQVVKSSVAERESSALRSGLK